MVILMCWSKALPTGVQIKRSQIKQALMEEEKEFVIANADRIKQLTMQCGARLSGAQNAEYTAPNGDSAYKQ